MRLRLPGIRIHHITNRKVICYCPFHKGGKEHSPSMEIALQSARWRCYTCSPVPRPVLDLLIDRGMSRERAVATIALMKSLAAKTEKPVEKECPEYLLGQYLGRRPSGLLRLGYTRNVLDEMEVGWDDTRKRVIYPIRSKRGTLLGVVGGAAVGKQDPRYEVLYGSSPKYLAYGPDQGFPSQVNPKASLWNLHRVVNSDDPRPLVVVEGYKALMWLRMAEVTRVVALCGATYAPGQVVYLVGIRGPHLLFLDNDATGRLTARKLIRELRRSISGVRIVRYPRDVAQPDDLELNEVKDTLHGSEGKTRKNRDSEESTLETDSTGPV